MLLENCIIAFTAHWKCCPNINVAIWGCRVTLGCVSTCRSGLLRKCCPLTSLPDCPFPSSLNIWPSRCFILTQKHTEENIQEMTSFLLGPTWLNSKSGPCWQPSRSFIAVKGEKSESGGHLGRGKWLEFKLDAKGGMLGRTAFIFRDRIFD